MMALLSRAPPSRLLICSAHLLSPLPSRSPRKLSVPPHTHQSITFSSTPPSLLRNLPSNFPGEVPSAFFGNGGSVCASDETHLARWILSFCFACLLLHTQHCEALPALAHQESRVALASSGRRFDPVSSREKEASEAFAKRVAQALTWLEKGQQAQAQGDFEEALLWYTQITETAGDLALAEYARVGRALSLYEVGDREQAVVEMEDVSISLKGYPEVHAALAAALYVDKHAPLPAEQQFSIATLLNPHYADLSYVRDTRHWPPSLIESLQKFINLQ